MKKLNRFCLLLISFLWVNNVVAGYQIRSDPPYGASKAEVAEAIKNCNQNEMTIAICEWSSYMETQTSLQRNVLNVERLLKLQEEKERLKYFKLAQRKWEQFRAADCDLDASAAEGGSMVTGLVYSCYEKITLERIKLLQHFSETLEAGTPMPLLFYDRK